MSIKRFKSNVSVKFFYLGLAIMQSYCIVSPALAWRGYIQVDEMTDEKIGFARSESYDNANMFVQCRNDGLYVAINWGELLSISEDSEEVEFRFDKEEPDSMTFRVKLKQSYVSGGLEIVDSIFKSDNVKSNKLVKLMKKHNELLMRTTDFADRYMTVKFSLSGFSAAYKEACGWWEREQAPPANPSEVYDALD